MLTPGEISRYARHLALPEVGSEGQERLKRGSVIVVGAGGLGSPASLYLAAAGVGRIALVDFDDVEESNLQRQILHGTSAVGTSKLESARRRLEDLNPHVEIVPIAQRLTSANAMEVLKEWDVIVDGTDNFPTRYLLNDAAVLLGKADVYGSLFRFEGQASVFEASRGPCYRCLYPEPPPPAMVPNCEEGGVLGAVPGVIGTIQAIEAIKILLGRTSTLVGRLLLFDAMRMQFRELNLRKDPACRVCGTHPTVTELIDYEGFCRVTPAGISSSSGADAPDVTPRELARRLEAGEDLLIIDVREPYERQVSFLPGSEHVPMRELPGRIGALPRDREIVMVCRSGVRSARACALLQAAGFAKVRNLSGGMIRWSREVDPSMPVA